MIKIKNFYSGEMQTYFIGRSLYMDSELTPYSDDYDQYLVKFVMSVNSAGKLEKTYITDTDEYVLDADEKVFEEYRQSCYKTAYDKIVETHDNKEKDPSVKDRVVIVKRGKTAVGTVGKVVVVIQKPYGMGYRSSMENKLGIATSPIMVDKVMPNGKVFQNHRDMVWVWARNCESENPVPPNLDEVDLYAKNIASSMMNDLHNNINKQNKKAA